MQCRMIVTMAIQEIWWHCCGILPSLCHRPWRGKTHTLLSDFWNYSWMQEQSLTSAVLTWLTDDNYGFHWRNITIQFLYASSTLQLKRKIWDIIFPAWLRSASIRRITDSVDSNTVLDDACSTRNRQKRQVKVKST